MKCSIFRQNPKGISMLFAIVFVVLICKPVLGSNESVQFTELIQIHKAEITQACATTITNILTDFQHIDKSFDLFSDISSAQIQCVGSSNIPTYHLLYQKGVHIERPSSYSLDSLRATQDRRVIDKGGGELEVYIANRDSPPMRFGGDVYSLLKIDGKGEMSLDYHLYLDSPDSILDKTVKNVIEKNVGLLRKQLQDIFGVDPAAEKAHACAPVMTNILSGLKALAQQYPILSNIDSATIETKGTNYLYQHLKFWNKVHVVDTNDFKPFQGHPLIGSTKVENGGIALDVFLRNKDEPFGFDPYNANTWVSDDHKTLFQYILYLGDSAGHVKGTDKAILNVIESQGDILIKKLNNIIDF